MVAAQWFPAAHIVPRGRIIAKFPVKFPVSREYVWREVRLALCRQPARPADREAVLNSHGKARQWRAFLIRCLVSVLRFHESKGRIRGKSLVDTANIPFLGDDARRPGSIYTVWRRRHRKFVLEFRFRADSHSPCIHRPKGERRPFRPHDPLPAAHARR